MGCSFAMLVASLTTPLLAADLTLAWDASPSPDVTGYVLAYGSQSGQHPNTIDAGAKTSATVTNLGAGQRYYFVAYAVNARGTRSNASAELAVTIPSASCSFTLSDNTAAFGATGGSLVRTVLAPAGCRWTVQTTVPWLIVQSGATGTGDGTFTLKASPKRAPGDRSTSLTIGNDTPSLLRVEQRGGTGPRFDWPRFDVDGDRLTDFTFWRPFSGGWYSLLSSRRNRESIRNELGTGAQRDQPVPADYDGDGRGDRAVWRSNQGMWTIEPSAVRGSAVQVPLGSSGDVAVPADYDGDGAADVAVWQPGSGAWLVKTSRSNFSTQFTVHLGEAGDVPVPGDYDGDGRADLAVWKTASGAWQLLLSHVDYSSNHLFVVQWGTVRDGDRPAAGDYDGDGVTDIAVWRDQRDATWRVLPSAGGFSDANAWILPLGRRGDTPIFGDYDGDGRADPAVWRGGWWHVIKSSSGYSRTESLRWGTSVLGDVPLPR